jgi:hypothetical protein
MTIIIVNPNFFIPNFMTGKISSGVKIPDLTRLEFREKDPEIPRQQDGASLMLLHLQDRSLSFLRDEQAQNSLAYNTLLRELKCLINLIQSFTSCCISPPRIIP